jgi:hypothetical protein
LYPYYVPVIRAVAVHDTPVGDPVGVPKAIVVVAPAVITLFEVNLIIFPLVDEAENIVRSVGAPPHWS